MFREEMRVLGLPGAEDVTDGSVDYYDMDWENVENGVTELRAGIIPAATLPPCPKSCKALAQKACPTPGQSWCERCVGAFTFNREKTKPGGFVNLPGLVFALASPM